MKSNSDVFIAFTLFAGYGLAMLASDIYLTTIDKPVGVPPNSRGLVRPRVNMIFAVASTDMLKLDPKKAVLLLRYGHDSTLAGLNIVSFKFDNIPQLADTTVFTKIIYP